jgi:hypothetical protein
VGCGCLGIDEHGRVWEVLWVSLGWRVGGWEVLWIVGVCA